MKFTRDRVAIGGLLVLSLLLASSLWHERPAAADQPFVVAKTEKAKKPKPEPKVKKPAPKPTKPIEEEEPDDADDGPAKLPPKMEYETVKLADGTEIQVEKWGETFEAYDYRPPVTMDDKSINEITHRPGGGGYGTIRIDSDRKKVYWTWSGGERPTGHIGRSDLDGKHPEVLVEGLLHPHHLVLDPSHQRIYWLEGIRAVNDLKGADLNGKKVEALIKNIARPSGLALDPERQELYFWEESGRIIRVKTDGTAESQFLGHDNDLAMRSSVSEIVWNANDGTVLDVRRSDLFA